MQPAPWMARHPAVFHITHHKAGSQWILAILRRIARPMVVQPDWRLDYLTGPLERGKVYPTAYITPDCVLDVTDLVFVSLVGIIDPLRPSAKEAVRIAQGAGIDVIGDYLTEVNVTCPTCIRELDAQFSLDIAGMLMDSIEKQRNA